MSADGGEQLTESQELRADREDVALDPVERASSFVSGITDRRRLVIDEPEERSDFWAELSANVAPTPDPPSVDFGSQVVIAATMGQRPTGGGYSIRIEGVSRAGAEMATVELGNATYALGGRPSNDALHSNIAERFVVP